MNQPTDCKEIEKMWVREVENRIDAYERGEMAAISAQEVFEKIDRKKNNSKQKILS